jgi:hypothetical protein
VPHSTTQLHKEHTATSTPERQAGVLVVHRHHLLCAVQPLAERADPPGPHPEWRVHLLGISGLSAQTRSADREL